MHIIALDVDGTLINQDGTIAGETKEQLQRLYSEGALVVIATGRPLRSIAKTLADNGIVPELGYPQAIITDERDIQLLTDGRYQGLEPHNSWAYAAEISYLEAAKDLVQQAALDLELFFFENNAYMQQSRGYMELYSRHPGVMEKVMDWFDAHMGTLPLRAIRNRRLLALRWEVTGKGWALEKLSEHLGFPRQNILSIGDSLNDYDMMTRDWSVATTDNGDPLIKDLVRQQGGRVASQGYSLGVAEILTDL